MYNGYKEIRGTTDEINELMFQMDPADWAINEYLIIHNTDENRTTEMRWTGS